MSRGYSKSTHSKMLTTRRRKAKHQRRLALQAKRAKKAYNAKAKAAGTEAAKPAS